jgi:hypothetical protein
MDERTLERTTTAVVGKKHPKRMVPQVDSPKRFMFMVDRFSTNERNY